jgi:hypothetical protein
VTIALELGTQTGLLQALLAAARTENVQVGVSDAQAQEMTLEHFPVAGSRRVLVRRTGNGNDNFPLPTTGALVLPANEARLGCRITNTGANPVLLYLADQARKGAPAIYLGVATPGNEVLGASWDGRLGTIAWAGNVFAVPQGGATTLAIAEL